MNKPLPVRKSSDSSEHLLRSSEFLAGSSNLLAPVKYST
jgi:hypothetical protein